MIEDEFGHIDYDESGEGPTVVLVPGSCSTGAAWRPIVAQWENGFRCVTTSLLGYGGTVERRTALDAGIAHEAEVLEAVIRRAAAPVHLVGHSFGGLSALAVALRKRVPLLSLTIAEAPAPEILRNMGEYRHYLAFRKMSEAYFRSFQAGETAAIEQMIDFYGGAGTFSAGRFVFALRPSDHAGQPSDRASAYDFELTLRYLRPLISRPQAVGWVSHPGVKRANELRRVHTERRVAAIAGRLIHDFDSCQGGGMIAQHVARTEHNGRSAAELRL
jgi:pimeloyl-ACP methyl ester carboxylesterase